jgi:hypothetical protein
VRRTERRCPLFRLSSDNRTISLFVLAGVEQGENADKNGYDKARRPAEDALKKTVEGDDASAEKFAKRLTRNECGTVFRVISMRWPEVAWFALVGEEICCVISVASILSCLRRQRGIISWH